MLRYWLWLERRWFRLGGIVAGYMLLEKPEQIPIAISEQFSQLSRRQHRRRAPIVLRDFRAFNSSNSRRSFPFVARTPDRSARAHRDWRRRHRCFLLQQQWRALAGVDDLATTPHGFDLLLAQKKSARHAVNVDEALLASCSGMPLWILSSIATSLTPSARGKSPFLTARKVRHISVSASPLCSSLILRRIGLLLVPRARGRGAQEVRPHSPRLS